MQGDRSRYIDVLKAIGVISVVFGHGGGIIPLGKEGFYWGGVVYTYHLPIFFFCSGYLLKNTDFSNPWGAISRRLRKLWTPFVVYSVLYILLANVFVNLSILDIEKYSLRTGIVAISSAMVLRSPNGLLGTFWFVPVLFLTTAAVLTIMHFTDCWKHADVIRVFVGILSGLIGICFSVKEVTMEYHMQTIPLMVPVMLLGYYYKRFEGRVRKYFNIIIGIIFFIFIYYLQVSKNVYIELSSNRIMTPFWCYPVMLMGLYFCLSLGNVIMKSEKAAVLISKASTYSFDIMALQFFCFKMIDLIYVYVGGGEIDKLNKFPVSFGNLRILYYVGGTILPILLRKGFDVLREHSSMIIKKELPGS